MVLNGLFCTHAVKKAFTCPDVGHLISRYSALEDVPSLALAHCLATVGILHVCIRFAVKTATENDNVSKNGNSNEENRKTANGILLLCCMFDLFYVQFKTSFISHFTVAIFSSCRSSPVAYLGFGKEGGHGERVEREPITGVWRRSPQWGPGVEPLVGGSRGEASLKLKHFLFLNVQWKPQIRPFFLKFGNAENHSVISDAISHGDFDHILYEKILSNIVEFCNSCWKTAKNAPFHIKSPVKNFYGWAKEGRGHQTVAPPKYATVLRCTL